MMVFMSVAPKFCEQAEVHAVWYLILRAADAVAVGNCAAWSSRQERGHEQGKSHYDDAEMRMMLISVGDACPNMLVARQVG